jgi:hypothetical protein
MGIGVPHWRVPVHWDGLGVAFIPRVGDEREYGVGWRESRRRRSSLTNGYTGCIVRCQDGSETTLTKEWAMKLKEKRDTFKCVEGLH